MAEELGEGWTEGVHPEDLRFCLATYQDAFLAREHFRMEYRLRRFDGEYRWIVDYGTPYYDAAGEWLGYIGACHDIGDLKQANEETKNFAYIVSHDFRAPLVNIRGYGQELMAHVRRLDSIIKENLTAIPPDQAAECLDILEQQIPEAEGFIASSVHRMDSLVSALLKLSRLGRHILYPEPVDTREVVNTTLSSISHQIQEKGVTITLGDLPTIIADRVALEQIFGNLLDNAVKYLDPSRPGGITVTSEMRELEVVFHVEDNGRGMKEDDIPNAFLVFRRVGKQDVPGDGMGLAFVKALLNEAGGRIWCSSRPGEGSRFSFSLPFVPHHRSEEIR
jgi:signal transduction histidine kinase